MASTRVSISRGLSLHCGSLDYCAFSDFPRPIGTVRDGDALITIRLADESIRF